MSSYRNFFKAFRLQTGSVEELNREFDLVKQAFSFVQAAIDKIDGTLGITPDAPTPTPVTGVNQADLYLSYGDQSGLATLPLPPEGSPGFYLRADTNNGVIQRAAGSPGSIWEFKIGEDVPSTAEMRLRLQVYYCNLTPAGITPPTLTIGVTKNDTLLSPASGNLNGIGGAGSGINVGPITHGGFVSGDRWGILVSTTEVGAGALMATAHATIRW